MKTENIDIGQLIFPEKNVRIHGKKQLEEIQKSIAMFGQIRPAVIDENYVILAGNGMVKAMLEMGKESVEVYKVVGLTENEKKKLMMADNKTFSLGVDNIDTIYEFIEELGNDLQIPGYDEELLKSMVATAEEVTEQLEEYGKLDQASLKKIENGREKKEEWIKQEKEETSKESVEEKQDITSLRENTVEQSMPVIPRQEEQKSIYEGGESPKETDEGNRAFVRCPKCGEKIWL